MNVIANELVILERELKEAREYLRNHRPIRARRAKTPEGMKLYLVNNDNGKEKRERIQFTDKRAKSFFVQQIFIARSKRLQRNVERLRKYLKYSEDASFEKIFAELQENYEIKNRNYLIEALQECRGAKASGVTAFKANESENFRQEGKIHISSSGKIYRSKSELSIEAELIKYNVDYNYESKIYCANKLYRPDFTITRNDGSVVIWEHFGMVNDDEYVEKMLVKYVDYVRQGIVPWDNLVVTFDKKNGGLDVEEIDFIIKHRILV